MKLRSFVCPRFSAQREDADTDIRTVLNKRIIPDSLVKMKLTKEVA